MKRGTKMGIDKETTGRLGLETGPVSSSVDGRSHCGRDWLTVKPALPDGLLSQPPALKSTIVAKVHGKYGCSAMRVPWNQVTGSSVIATSSCLHQSWRVDGLRYRRQGGVDNLDPE